MNKLCSIPKSTSGVSNIFLVTNEGVGLLVAHDIIAFLMLQEETGNCTVTSEQLCDSLADSYGEKPAEMLLVLEIEGCIRISHGIPVIEEDGHKLFDFLHPYYLRGEL